MHSIILIFKTDLKIPRKNNFKISGTVKNFEDWHTIILIIVVRNSFYTIK